MNGKTTKPSQKAAVTLSGIEDLRGKGMNQSQIAEWYGVSRQAISWHLKTYGGRLTPRGTVQEEWPWETSVEHSKSKAYQRLRDHGEFMETGGRGMNEDKMSRLNAWWKKLRDENVVLEFDPNIAPIPGVSPYGGFAYRPRVATDGNLLIRVNEYTALTVKGAVTWCWPVGWSLPT